MVLKWSRFGECEDSDDDIDVIPPAPLPKQKRVRSFVVSAEVLSVTPVAGVDV